VRTTRADERQLRELSKIVNRRSFRPARRSWRLLAVAGVARTPGAGIEPAGRSVRIVMYWLDVAAAALAGREKKPT
jgi:hypothetical protein